MIYLDNNATTPIDPRVAAVMKPLLAETFANPASEHAPGVKARQMLEESRGKVASLLGVDTREVVLTSGGTESNNIAIRGAAFANRHKGRHIITSAVEHPAVSEVCLWLAKNGFDLTILPVTKDGFVERRDLEASYRRDTVLVTIMLANNEVGTIQRIAELAEVTRGTDALFHTDAAQAVGKIPVDARALGVDLLSVAGHKLYAPKGIGALYVRGGVDVEPVLLGANHESGVRPGTQNVLLAAGLAEACVLAKQEVEEEGKRLRQLRDEFELRLFDELGASTLRINAVGSERLPNTSSVSFRGVDAGLVLAEIGDRLAASAGAACHADQVEKSPVLHALGVSDDWAMGTIRISLGRQTTAAEVEEAVGILSAAVKGLAGASHPNLGPESTDAVRLTQFTKGLGCGCKLAVGGIEDIIASLPRSDDIRVIRDQSSMDDAAVFAATEETTVVQTVDLITPVDDDPYSFGAIAAANSLSDIYAMGAEPLFALSVVGFPSARLSHSVLNQMLQGMADKCSEAEISIIGGHTIDDPEPKLGLAVTGLSERGRFWPNDGAHVGDAIVLTKPLGTGLIVSGMRNGTASTKAIDRARETMLQLNRNAASALSEIDVHACTDVTGFGLLGHLAEMLRPRKLRCEICYQNVPILDDALRLAETSIVSSGTRSNLAHLSGITSFGESVTSSERLVLADAQTSGGLLFAVSSAEADAAIGKLVSAGVEWARRIGEITEAGVAQIVVT